MSGRDTKNAGRRFHCGRFTRSCVALLLVLFVVSFHNFHRSTLKIFGRWQSDDQYGTTMYPQHRRTTASLSSQQQASNSFHHEIIAANTTRLDDGPRICFITSQFVTSPETADKLLNVQRQVPELASSSFVTFFVFTNVEGLTAPGWKIIVKDLDLNFKRLVTLSRWPKFQAFHDDIVQKHCEVVFYLDGTVVPRNSLEAFQLEARRILASNVQLSQTRHKVEDITIEKEFKRILGGRKDIYVNVNKSLEWLHAQPDFKSDCQMFANNIFGYALESRAFRDTSNFFWSHYSKEEDSWRDQPLWCYSLHHLGVTPLDFPNTLYRIDHGRKGFNGHFYTSHTNNEVQLAAQRKERQEAGIFNLLCTSSERSLHYGSYKLRCEDFSSWIKQCAPKVNVTTGLSIEHILSLQISSLSFDATIITKGVPLGTKTRGLPLELGNIYIDLIDNYQLKGSQINTAFTLIMQTKQQKERFLLHKHKVVEHWYNSYPADMQRGDNDPEVIPSIANINLREMRLATVWNTLASETEGACPHIGGVENVSYACIEQEFEIEDWYANVVNATDVEQEVNKIMADPMLGRGKLYYNLFQQYDVLVALAKNNLQKLRYGNVQRIVSQMRSGVPVLIEVRGAVLDHFMDKFKYKCAFQRVDTYQEYHYESGSPYMTFEEAVEKMKDAEFRKECQEHGLKIAREYSPNVIGKKFLKAVGYNGDFQC